MHEHDAIHTNHTAHIFKQNLQPNPVRIFGILQMAVATTRDGRDVGRSIFSFQQGYIGFREDQSRAAFKSAERKGGICKDAEKYLH